MKMATFIENSNVPPRLIRTVARQLGSWKYFQESASDIANHGADGGWSGFTYYWDTIPFFRKNRSDILKLAEDLASDLGEDLLTLISGFNCLKRYGFSPSEIAVAVYQSRGAECDNIQNALAWFALEEVARSYVDCVESLQTS